MMKSSEIILSESMLNTVLDIGGLVPGMEMLDLANAFLYASSGDYLMAALSMISMIPVLGDAVGKGGKVAVWIEKNVGKNAAKNVVKYGPEVIAGINKAKAAILQNMSLIGPLFLAIDQQAKEGSMIAYKIAPYLPRIKQALQVFVSTPMPQAQPQTQQMNAPGTPAPAMEGLFLPSMQMVFENVNIPKKKEKKVRK
jgi:hypothetical protein